MNPLIARKLILPLHERLRHRRTFPLWRELESSQWLDVEALRDIQLRKLRRLVRTALTQTDYYAEFADVDADWQPERLEDLRKLPLLDKATLAEHREEMVNREVEGGARKYRTGGSSGTPLIFYFDRRRQAYDKAARMRTHKWWGVLPGHREAYIWNSPVELSGQDRIKRFRDWLANEKLFPASELSPETVADFVQGLRRFKPRCLFGYPSAMTLLCELAREAKLDLTDLPVEVVFSTAEVLHPHQEQTISETLGGVPVANGYGSREAGFISHQCPEGSMHITSENVIVEVVDAQGQPVEPGEKGEIIVTQLDCLATPFLRYRTSDVGSLRAEKCPCGRGLELMDVVEGRSNDFLIMSDGRRIHSSAIHAALSGLAGICSFQLRQEASGHIRVLLVVDEQWSEESQSKLRANLSERFGSGATFALEYCDEIPPSASGKYRYVISELSALQNTRP